MTFIIAEAGINHNGSLRTAKELVDVSKESGANAVKFQTFWNLGRLKEYELTRNAWESIVHYCYDKRIEFISTPHSIPSIAFLDNFVRQHKVASPYLTNEEFVRRVNYFEKPVLLSTGSLTHESGMATLEEIDTAIAWLHNCEVTLLHCVSKYPCENPHYERIEELKQFGLPVGLSDHSKNIKIDMKIPVLEKHIMLPESTVHAIDKDVSLEPEQFKEMVQYMRSRE